MRDDGQAVTKPPFRYRLRYKAANTRAKPRCKRGSRAVGAFARMTWDMSKRRPDVACRLPENAKIGLNDHVSVRLAGH